MAHLTFCAAKEAFPMRHRLRADAPVARAYGNLEPYVGSPTGGPLQEFRQRERRQGLSSWRTKEPVVSRPAVGLPERGRDCLGPIPDSAWGPVAGQSGEEKELSSPVGR